MVLAVGRGGRDRDGGRIEMDVKVGDRVLFAKYAGIEVKFDGKKICIMRESDVLGVVKYADLG